MCFSPSHHILKNSSARGVVVGTSCSSNQRMMRFCRNAAIVPIGKKEIMMRDIVVITASNEVDCYGQADTLKGYSLSI